jgi:hypothetical protein
MITKRTRLRPARVALTFSLSALAIALLPLHLLEAVPPIASGAAAITVEASEAAAEKLRRIQEAAASGTVGFITEFSELEVNSYLAYELAPRYPSGVSEIQIQFQPSRILGTSVVDFDKAKAARSSPGRMTDYLFWGTHTIAAEGNFSGIDGVGHFDLESVAIDGVTVPQAMVDLLIETFLKPRYPGLALDAPFLLPDSVDRVQVMRGSIAVEVNPPSSR